MAKVIPIGQPVNEAERQAIAFLRDHLPDGWLIFHNFEMRQGTEVFEIDLAVLGPHALYLADVKGTRGLIDVYGSKWYPEGRQPFHSPLATLRQHTKAMATLIRESNPGLTELRRAHVHATVLLTADDAILQDPFGLDGPDVTDFKHCLKYFRDLTRIPAHRAQDIRTLHTQISKAITGNAKPRQAARVFRDWQVEERLGGTDRFTEYRAKHTLLGNRGGMARLRVYQVDPYQDDAGRKAEHKRISNAFHAVTHMPPHSNILTVREFFGTDDQDQLVLVTEDVAGQALRQHIKKPSLALTFDQKLQVMRDLLDALDHAHRYEVIHRNLTPDAIIVTKGGQIRVTAFDYARVGKSRTSTIADQIVDDLEPVYQAPECYRDPAQASIASDLYAVGLILYELLTGELPFEDVDQMMEADGKFPILPSAHKADLPKGIDIWLQKFCEFDPEERHISAAVARKALDDMILPPGKDAASGDAGHAVEPARGIPKDLTNLPMDFILAERFRIQKRLGVGGFGVAYKVFDSLGDVVRVLKLVTRDRRSVYERLRREYKTLTNLPEHPHVVKVIWADRMGDAQQTPYIVFEYVEGLDVADLIETEALALEDAFTLVREATEGLLHLHSHGVYHQDIKPSNLLLTDKGVRIIDFNVAVSEQDDVQGGGGTRRYLPPDYDYSTDPQAADRIDRDLYALGITFYECLTGCYPFDEPTPPIKTQPKDPRQIPRTATVSRSLVDLLIRMIAPERSSRFASADELLKAFAEVKRLREIFSSSETIAGSKVAPSLSLSTERPNFNPFVTHLLTLYSQSQATNAGTRGLDEIGKATYVPTFLDDQLVSALLTGQFRLVIISGNAGDGKTAFIQQFEALAREKGAQGQYGANGAIFQIKGHTFQSNYDGSQDEGNEHNDSVLMRFFDLFQGNDSARWPTGQTRIIAINAGRLLDFFLEHEATFPLLARHVRDGIAGGKHQDGVAVINLNLRSVVAESEQGKDSILERLIGRMTQKEYWVACEQCDLQGKCYACHNAFTFQDAIAGPKVLERLKMLYTITHLRGRLHITMRDLRSAVAFMLVGSLDCDGIHQIYRNGGEAAQNQILDGFYFNAWIGGREGSADRLIALLREIDVAQVSNPDIDRKLGFLPPDEKGMRRFGFGGRPAYDQELIGTLFHSLPREYATKNRKGLIDKHRHFVAHLRRRHFFECRDEGWRSMLPYASIGSFLHAIRTPSNQGGGGENAALLIRAINRGEGIAAPECLGNRMALRVREVERGTIHSYRLFDGDHFTVQTELAVLPNPFLESLPHALILRYDAGGNHRADLKINLDIYEMLMRLEQGYSPSVEETEGFYLSLTVFKNVLSAAPYQEVLLTESGFDFFRIRRDGKGVLHLDRLERGAGQ